MKTKTVMGFVTFSAIVGGSAYLIYRYKKNKEEGVEEGPITLDEARAMTALREQAKNSSVQVGEMLGMNREEIEEIIDDSHDTAGYNESFNTDKITKENEKSTYFDDVDFNIPLADTITEEEKKLRYDPNSTQALHQFMKMELAESLPMDPSYQAMVRLFDFPFEPKNDGDNILFTQLIDYRAQFFGMGSKWTQAITMADVILHYARLTDYNVGAGVWHWVEHMVISGDFIDIQDSIQIGDVIERLNNHTHFNEEMQTFGLFALDRYQMDEASKVARQNLDPSLTYEIEFNVFLQGCI